MLYHAKGFARQQGVIKLEKIKIIATMKQIESNKKTHLRAF